MRLFDYRMVVYMSGGSNSYRIIYHGGISETIDLPDGDMRRAQLGSEQAQRRLVAIVRAKLRICWINYGDVRKMKLVS